MVYNIIKGFPHFIGVRSSHDNAFLDSPCFAEMTVPDNFIFETIILRIDAAGQDKHTIRQFRFIFFASCHNAVFIFKVAAIFPKQTESRIVNNLHPFRIAKSLEIQQQCVRP